MKVGTGAEAHKVPSSPVVSQFNQVGEDQNVVRVFSALNENAKDFLAKLLAYKNGVTGDEFEQQSGIKSNTWGGKVGGLSKIAKGNGLKIEKFVISEFRTEGSRRYRFLKPGPLLVRYADRLRA